MNPPQKRDASPGSMHNTGCLGLVHWDDPGDGMGREEGGGFRMGKTIDFSSPVLPSIITSYYFY